MWIFFAGACLTFIVGYWFLTTMWSWRDEVQRDIDQANIDRANDEEGRC